MVNGIYVTEIQTSGLVMAVYGSLPEDYLVLLPKLSDNLFELNDIESSNFFTLNKTILFTENTPTILFHSINQITFQLTAHCYKKDTAFIYWQFSSQSEISNTNSIKSKSIDEISISRKEELNTSLSLDFIDGILLPIFELTLLPNDRYHFEYANAEMLSLFPNLDMANGNADIRIVFSSLNYQDKEYFINTLKNIDSSKTWSLEFRILVDNKIKWFKGVGHFSKRSISDSYTLRAYLKDITNKKKVSSHSSLLEFAFRNAVTPIYYVNQDASFFDFNDAANNSIGYSREELLKMQIHDFDPYYQEGSWKSYWSLLKINRTSTLKTIHRKKDGTLMNVQIVSNLIRFEERDLVCAYVFDLTEKQKLENEVLLANFSFKHLHTPIHIISKTGLILKYNPAAQALLGYSEEQYRTLHVHDIDPFYTVEAWPSHWEELKKAGRNTFNTINKNRDGILIPVEIITNFIIFEGQELIFAFFLDISQKVAEEERLRLLESVIINTNDAVIITDAETTLGPSYKIIYVNEAFTKMTGYTSEEVIGKNPKLLQSGKSDVSELEKMREGIRTFEPCEATLLNVKKNGEEFWVNTHINPVANRDGKFTHFIAVQRDITQQKITEFEKERVLEELVAKNKKLRQFSFIATHNLRAPLTNLLSASRMMKAETVNNPLTKTLIDIFKKSTLDLNDTLNTLINTLLIQDNENVLIQKLSFSNTFEKVRSINSHSIANTCCMISSDFSAIDEVNFNAEYLESIFQNLITNSIKYADPSRQPEIIIKTKIIDPKIIQLTFSDNGIGMDMNLIRGRIFGLNQRFHDHVDSKGVGLFLVQTQLTALGGTISVKSEEHVGTTFYVNFKRK